MEELKKDIEATQEKDLNQEEYDSFAKEGYVHLINTKNDKKLIVYIEKDMPLNVAFDGAFDIAVHLRDLYKEQLRRAIDKAKEEKEEN